MSTAKDIIEKRKQIREILEKELAGFTLPYITIGDLFLNVEDDGSLTISIEGFNTHLSNKDAAQLFEWGSKLYPYIKECDDRPYKSPPLRSPIKREDIF